MSRYGEEWVPPSWQPSAPPSYATPTESAPYTGPGASSGWVSDTAVAYDTSRPVYPDATPQTQGAVRAQGTDWGGLFTGIASGLVNIFGQPVGGRPPTAPPPSKPAVPVWVWVAVPVAGVAMLALLLRGGKRAAVAGYRRKSRR